MGPDRHWQLGNGRVQRERTVRTHSAPAVQQLQAAAAAAGNLSNTPHATR